MTVNLGVYLFLYEDYLKTGPTIGMVMTKTGLDYDQAYLLLHTHIDIQQMIGRREYQWEAYE